MGVNERQIIPKDASRHPGESPQPERITRPPRCATATPEEARMTHPTAALRRFPRYARIAGLALLLAWSVAASAGPLRAPRPAVDCPSCDDFNFCTVDSCDTATGTCRHDPLNCDDGNRCTTDACDNDPDTARQGCFHLTLPDGTACDDGKDRKSTRLNSSHGYISYAVFCLKKKKKRLKKQL